jgi:hypothetical protein
MNLAAQTEIEKKAKEEKAKLNTLKRSQQNERKKKTEASLKSLPIYYDNSVNAA